MQETPFAFQKSVLHHGDCLIWLKAQPERSIHAVVTDPPYGLYEYTDKNQEKIHFQRQCAVLCKGGVLTSTSSNHRSSFDVAPAQWCYRTQPQERHSPALTEENEPDSFGRNWLRNYGPCRLQSHRCFTPRCGRFTDGGEFTRRRRRLALVFVNPLDPSAFSPAMAVPASRRQVPGTR